MTLKGGFGIGFTVWGGENVVGVQGVVGAVQVRFQGRRHGDSADTCVGFRGGYMTASTDELIL